MSGFKNKHMITTLKAAFAIILITLGLSGLIAWFLNKKFGLNAEGVFYVAELIQLTLIIFLI